MKGGGKNTQESSSTGSQSMRPAPLRSISECISGNGWEKPDMADLGSLQKQVIQNLVYYQTNYAVLALPFFVLVALYRPAALIFGLAILAALVGGFIFSTKNHTQLRDLTHNKPVVMLVAILAGTFFILRMFSTVFAFVVGIALPLALIVAHAAARKLSLQNNAWYAIESLSLQATPMGMVLSALGARDAEKKSPDATSKGGRK